MSAIDLVCPGCSDTGWFEFTDPHNTTRVTACACWIGLLRRGPRPPLADVVPEDQWRAVWPDGLPVPTDEWVTPLQLTAAQVPPQMRAWTRATYPTTPANADKVAKADAWIAERGHGSDVVLVGSHGTGKTGLALVMLRGALMHGCTARYTLASDLLRAVRQTYQPEAEANERDVLEQFARPDVLLIDELVVKSTEFAEDTFNWLIETRQRHLRATLITTNVGGTLAPDDAVLELRGYLGPLIFDRLRERGQFWRLNGESLRPTYGATR